MYWSASSPRSPAIARCSSVPDQVVERIRVIAHSSRRIQEIVQTVDAITLQTRLLSLNAAVEAARAGEQGRGFAVVATEVRQLASRSRQASTEIRSLVLSTRALDETARNLHESITRFHVDRHVA